MTATLPKPPSLNHYWRFTSKPFPHWYISAQGKAWREEASWILKAAQGRSKTITEEVGVTLDLYLCRHTDLDNFAKIILDTLTTSKVIEDDKQVASIQLRRFKVPHMVDERLELELTIL